MKPTIYYTLGVEKDDYAKGRYMVVIRDSRRHILGVPLRDEDKETAERLLGALRFAFDYGMTAVRMEVDRVHINLVEK